jgi:SAM-dependent methyltransferase
MLDVGCGSGAYCEFAALNEVKLVVGIELNKSYLHSSKSISVMQADALNLPFRNDIFDVVVSFEVFEHLPSEEPALKEIARVMSGNAFLSISVPNKFYPFETHGLRIAGTTVGIEYIGFPFFSWLPQFIRKYMERARIYTKKGLHQILQKAGFEPIATHHMMPRLERVSSIRYSRFRRPLRELLDKFEGLPFFSYFGLSIICISKKRSKHKQD